MKKLKLTFIGFGEKAESRKHVSKQAPSPRVERLSFGRGPCALLNEERNLPDAAQHLSPHVAVRLVLESLARTQSLQRTQASSATL